MSLPENVREKYEVFMKKEISIHHLYGFIQDKYYFNIMDEILKVNPNQKFFISHDLNYELISYYKDRYGEKVMFKEEVLDAVYDYMDNMGLLKKDFKYGNIVPNIVDLFCLCHCSFLIKSNMSTWSNFAQIYSNLEHVEILEGNESIIKKAMALNPNYDEEIAAIAKEGAYDLILTGKETIDYNSASIGSMLCALLDQNYIAADIL